MNQDYETVSEVRGALSQSVDKKFIQSPQQMNKNSARITGGVPGSRPPYFVRRPHNLTRKLRHWGGLILAPLLPVTVDDKVPNDNANKSV